MSSQSQSQSPLLELNKILQRVVRGEKEAEIEFATYQEDRRRGTDDDGDDELHSAVLQHVQTVLTTSTSHAASTCSDSGARATQREEGTDNRLVREAEARRLLEFLYGKRDYTSKISSKIVTLMTSKPSDEQMQTWALSLLARGDCVDIHAEWPAVVSATVAAMQNHPHNAELQQGAFELLGKPKYYFRGIDPGGEAEEEFDFEGVASTEDVAVTTVAAMRQHSTNVAIQAKACHVLFLLFYQLKAIHQAGGLMAISQAMQKYPDDVSLQTNACLFFGAHHNMACLSDEAFEVLEESGEQNIKDILQAARNHPHERPLIEAAVNFFAGCEGSSIAEFAFRAGGVETLLQILQYHPCQFDFYVCKALHSLIMQGDGKSCAMFAQNDGVSVFFDILQSESFAPREDLMRMEMLNIFHLLLDWNRDAVTALITGHSGGMETIVELYMRRGDTVHHIGCGGLLSKLARCCSSDNGMLPLHYVVMCPSHSEKPYGSAFKRGVVQALLSEYPEAAAFWPPSVASCNFLEFLSTPLSGPFESSSCFCKTDLPGFHWHDFLPSVFIGRCR